ncbi:MAG: hypothetical protein M1343_08540 [Chloroflexi bacterium]|nr:hypothetical protein [Chloroflexota bacterium]MDA8189380.1 hypothetical protein [Dehalococcoidales bacterium]
METRLGLGELPRISQAELKDKLRRGEDIVIVDAREQGAFAASNIRPKGSVRIPPGSQNGEIARLPKDKEIVTVCT